ncbi:hypothetical protein [Streptomyces sp. NPDC003635]
MAEAALDYRHRATVDGRLGLWEPRHVEELLLSWLPQQVTELPGEERGDGPGTSRTPVDLEMLAMLLEGGPAAAGGRLDLSTGECRPTFTDETDELETGWSRVRIPKAALFRARSELF